MGRGHSLGTAHKKVNFQEAVQDRDAKGPHEACKEGGGSRCGLGGRSGGEGGLAAWRRGSPCRRLSRRLEPHSREGRLGSQEWRDGRENMAAGPSPSLQPGLRRDRPNNDATGQRCQWRAGEELGGVKGQEGGGLGVNPRAACRRARPGQLQESWRPGEVEGRPWLLSSLWP